MNADLVEDALGKAFRAGVRYCFTWNVQQFVLFDSHIQGVPFIQRQIEGPTNVADVAVSDDVNRQWAYEAIREFWMEFLHRFADLIEGRRVSNSLQSTNASSAGSKVHSKHQSSTLLRHWRTFQPTTHTSGANLELGWSIKDGNPPHATNWNARTWTASSRLACYILLTRLVFYQVLRRRFRQLPALSVDGTNSPDDLRDLLNTRFKEAVEYLPRL